MTEPLKWLNPPHSIYQLHSHSKFLTHQAHGYPWRPPLKIPSIQPSKRKVFTLIALLQSNNNIGPFFRGRAENIFMLWWKSESVWQVEFTPLYKTTHPKPLFLTKAIRESSRDESVSLGGIQKSGEKESAALNMRMEACLNGQGPTLSVGRVTIFIVGRSCDLLFFFWGHPFTQGTGKFSQLKGKNLSLSLLTGRRSPFLPGVWETEQSLCEGWGWKRLFFVEFKVESTYREELYSKP